MDLLQYGFFQHALLGSLLTAIACGIVGTYIVSRRLVFISGGITHASFGGLGLGFYLGMNPILMAMLFSVLSAFGVEWASKTQNVREDSAIAGIWSLGMALGVIFIFLTPGYAPNLSAYLFGNILTVSTGQNFWIIIACALAVFAIVQIIQDTFLVPKIMGKITGLNPAIILLSLSIWGSLMGMLGMIIALPLTTLMLSYYQRFIINKEKIKYDEVETTDNQETSSKKEK